MESIYRIITDTNLDYKDKRHQLCLQAENSLPYVSLGSIAQNYLTTGVIDDLFEGHAPYRPRYLLPDYQKFLHQGSEYLALKPPKSLLEAVNALLIIYRHVPSVTGYPVYLGQIDDLLEPFLSQSSPEEAQNLLKFFLVNIDRTLSNAFVHMNIGPQETKTGNLLLKLEKELKHSVPNLSLKLSSSTPDSFLNQALDTALSIGKPYLVNHDELVRDLGLNYGIASCYNTLLVGGGSHTLVRLNLKMVAEMAKDYHNFINNALPEAINSLIEIINARAKFLVEKARFFETSFLSREGLIELNKFTSMAGIYGLYEAINLLSGLTMGKDSQAENYALEILQKSRELLEQQEGLYCQGFGNRLGFHAQSGTDADFKVTPGVRFKCGEEPLIYEQIDLQGKLHSYFNTGISDIYTFATTAAENISAVQQIVRTAMKRGIRIMAVSGDNSQFIRVTGYLVKKTDLEKYYQQKSLREDTVKIAAKSIVSGEVWKRRVHNKP